MNEQIVDHLIIDKFLELCLVLSTTFIDRVESAIYVVGSEHYPAFYIIDVLISLEFAAFVLEDVVETVFFAEDSPSVESASLHIAVSEDPVGKDDDRSLLDPSFSLGDAKHVTLLAINEMACCSRFL